MYAICEYPKVFGGAACLSTHWPGIFTMENNPVPNAFQLSKKTFAQSKNTQDIFRLRGCYTGCLISSPSAKADATMKQRGFTSANWLTKYFPGEEHSEKAWHKRLAVPLTFLLGR